MRSAAGLLSNPKALASVLSSRCGILLCGDFETVDGAVWTVVRPEHLPRPNGFSIVVTRSPSHVSALFRLDTFGRELAEMMGFSGPEAHSSFAALVDVALTHDVTVSVIVNGQPNRVGPESPAVPWRSLEIECDRWLPPTLRDNQLVERLACDVAFTCLSLVLQLLVTREVNDEGVAGVYEGACTQVLVSKYERSAANRTACILAHGTTCKVCGFQFGGLYGEIGENYIEVHHVTPLALMRGGMSVNPIRDLVPVCANCHAMFHRQSPPLAVDDLRSRLHRSLGATSIPTPPSD